MHNVTDSIVSFSNTSQPHLFHTSKERSQCSLAQSASLTLWGVHIFPQSGDFPFSNNSFFFHNFPFPAWFFPLRPIVVFVFSRSNFWCVSRYAHVIMGDLMGKILVSCKFFFLKYVYIRFWVCLVQLSPIATFVFSFCMPSCSSPFYYSTLIVVMAKKLLFLGTGVSPNYFHVILHNSLHTCSIYLFHTSLNLSCRRGFFATFLVIMTSP